MGFFDRLKNAVNPQEGDDYENDGYDNFGDDNYFDESDVISYYDFLVNKYQDEWVIIDDIREGGSDEGAV